MTREESIAAVRDALRIAENAAWMANVAAEDAADVAATAAEAAQKDAPVRRQRRAADELPESDVLYGESPDY